MRLFHFSEEGDISVFNPRPVATPTRRAAGMDWLNGPLVWAIDDPRQAMYLFPRECPRILLWPLETTTPEDRHAYWTTSCRMIAYIELNWFARLAGSTLYRYELPKETFECLHDAGMWVSRSSVLPTDVCNIDDIPAAMCDADVELRAVPTLEPLMELWRTSFHVSGIRLRNMKKAPA